MGTGTTLNSIFNFLLRSLLHSPVSSEQQGTSSFKTFYIAEIREYFARQSAGFGNNLCALRIRSSKDHMRACVSGVKCI